jgi:hypothetical protein
MRETTDEPIVAAIMPTYNHGAFVGRAIESVLAQTSDSWELVVVDDGSTDGTLDIVRSYRDPRIRVIARDHGGMYRLGELYRAALEASTAPLLAILEGDDTWPPDKLARQIPDFRDSGVVLSYGVGWLIDQFGCRYGRVEPAFPKDCRTNEPVGSILPFLLSNNAILSPTVVLRRSALEAVGGFWQPEGVPYLDHPTWLLLAGQGRFAYQSAAVGSWRRHPGQWTTRTVESDSASPEADYLDLAAARLSGDSRAPSQLPANTQLLRGHSERAEVNRWRLALLSAGPREVIQSFLRLLRSGRPRLVGLALMGLAMRAVGSDLEWLQVRRHRVAWPSRRHARTHRRTSRAIQSRNDPVVPATLARARQPSGNSSLTVLITNLTMDWPSGTVVYARDLALELQRQGHRPIVYTWLKGRVSRDLEAAGIEVRDNLWRIDARPDVIHGHHRPLVRGALLRFPNVPAVALCHNPTDPWDAPLPDPAIRRYLGVSELCVKRLLRVGAPADRTELRPNFVDLDSFAPRPPLAPTPTRALVFSNYASAHTHLPVVQEACRRLSLSLDVVGRGVGRATDHPERLLADYDLVFAVGKAGMEAMAVGAAVILCDFAGLGPLVTTDNFDRLRSLNFGLGALKEAVTPEGVLRQVGLYDPAEATRVRQLVRSRCGLDRAVEELVGTYEQAIEEAKASGAAVKGDGSTGRATASRRSVLRYRVSKIPFVAFYRAFGLGPRRVPAPLKPFYRVVRAAMRDLLWVK